MKYDNLMVDIETVGICSNAVILSIGAVPFLIDNEEILKKEECFYREISLKSNDDYNRSYTGSTLAWWMSQSKEARQVFSNQKDKSDLAEALSELQVFIANRCSDTCKFWARDASFDMKILNNAFKGCEIDFQFSYRNELSVRTIEFLTKRLDKEYFNEHWKFKGTVHNALDDAWHQSTYIIKFIKLLES